MAYRKTILSLFIIVASIIVVSCEKDDPSVLKIYVRSSTNSLVQDAEVRIVGDVNKDTPEYFKERKTNGEGIAVFELDELFEEYEKNDEMVAYFTVYARDTAEFFTLGDAKAKAHLTTSETIILDE